MRVTAQEASGLLLIFLSLFKFHLVYTSLSDAKDTVGSGLTQTPPPPSQLQLLLLELVNGWVETANISLSLMRMQPCLAACVDEIAAAGYTAIANGEGRHADVQASGAL